MRKGQVAFIICTVAITLVGIASVQIGVRQYVAQEAIALGSPGQACPSCDVNFSAVASASNTPSSASTRPVSAVASASNTPSAASTQPASATTSSPARVKHNVSVLYFWQPNCAACEHMTPSIEQIKGNYPAVHVVFSNIAANAQSAQTHGVTVTPTTIVLRDDKEVNRYTGEFDIAALKQQLDVLASG